MVGDYNPDDAVDAVALAWLRERPGTPVEGIGIVTRLWMCAKLLGEDRRRYSPRPVRTQRRWTCSVSCADPASRIS